VGNSGDCGNQGFSRLPLQTPETQIATQTVANNSGRSRLTAYGAISHESTDVIWFKTFKRNRPPAKLGKQEIADVAQAVETRCRRQPAYILEILLKALKLFTYNLRNRRRFRRNDSPPSAACEADDGARGEGLRGCEGL
jgi:hypothetical protein